MVEEASSGASGARRSTTAPTEVADRPLELPHISRLPLTHPMYDEVLRRHAAALVAEQAGYTDPVTGLFVMTAATHVRRGWCCQRGCRHCPYID